MKVDIRTRLMIRFTLIVTVILFFLCMSIYWFSASYRKSEFYSRLENRITTTAKLLLEVPEVDAYLLTLIDNNSQMKLYNEALVIFDKQNRIIYRLRDTLIISPELINRVRLEKEIHFRQGKYEALGMLFNEGASSFVVVAMAQDYYGNRKLNFLKWILLAGCFISTIVSFMAGKIYAARALKPIADMVNQVNRITFENLGQRLDEGNRSDEIARLAITFNNMLDRLVSTVEMKNDFVSNATHEMRTSLTSIKGQIEVALMKSRSAEVYQKTLKSLQEDTGNLIALTNSLLDMAKVNADNSSIFMQVVRIDEILWEAYAELTARKPEYSVVFRFDGPVEEEKDLTVNGNPQLLKSAIYNLAINGCKFSADHKVEILITTSPESVTLKFSDTGIGIPEEETDKVLNPFYRASNARSITGSGLGLSLTNRIVLLHHGMVTIDSTEGTGTTVTLELPVVNSLG